MSAERNFNKIPEWEKAFDKRFKGSVFRNYLGDLVYSHGASEWNEDTEGDEAVAQVFWFSPLEYSDIERLMKKSLEAGEDLILKECKNRPYDCQAREKQVEAIFFKKV